MTTEVLGSLSFLEIPTVAGAPVLLNAGGVPSIQSGTFASRPAAGNVGTLYVDTTNNLMYRDNGTTWDTIGASTTYTGTTNEIVVAGPVIGIADNPIIPGAARVRVPVGTTAQRPGSPVAGDVRFNTSTNFTEEYNGSFWSPMGRVLQVVTGSIGANSTTSQIPNDNTVPASGEGAIAWTTSFTPISATSTILVIYSMGVAASANNTNIATSVFSGTTNRGSAVTRCATSTGTAGVQYPITNQCSWVSGSTATITIQARFGPMSGTTAYCNNHATPFFGGALVSQYMIMEIA